jgi:hypothetical protein
MRNWIQFGVIIGAVTAIVACSNRSNLPPAKRFSALDTTSGTFRVGLQQGDSGADVTSWQQFLISQNAFGLTHDDSDHDPVNGSQHSTYPNGAFDGETAQATSRFQSSFAYDIKGMPSANGPYHLRVDGTVNCATYFRAVGKGMPKFKVSKRLLTNGRRLPHFSSPRTGILTAPPYGSIVMELTMGSGCVDSKYQTNDPDVSLWQYFLYENGYLEMYPPSGAFGTSTAAATTLFQLDTHNISPTTGTVTQATYTDAYGWTNGYSLPSLVKQGATVTPTPKPCP